MWKLTADITPIEALDISFEYAYKLDDYNSTVLGMQKAEENEFIVDGNYIWKGIKFFAFFDYDVSNTEQTQRSGTTDPSLPPTTTNFNWQANLHNNNYAYGVGTSVPLIKDKLAFHRPVRLRAEQRHGKLHVTDLHHRPDGPGINNGNIDIGPWDDYTRQNISARLDYDYDKNFGLIFGFLYSQFRLNDGQLQRLPVRGARPHLSHGRLYGRVIQGERLLCAGRLPVLAPLIAKIRQERRTFKVRLAITGVQHPLRQQSWPSLPLNLVSLVIGVQHPLRKRGAGSVLPCWAAACVRHACHGRNRRGPQGGFRAAEDSKKRKKIVDSG